MASPIPDDVRRLLAAPQLRAPVHPAGGWLAEEASAAPRRPWSEGNFAAARRTRAPSNAVDRGKTLPRHGTNNA